MGTILDLLQAAAGEASLRDRLGRWRQAVSLGLESVEARVAAFRASVAVEDEAVPIGNFTTFNFIGAGVTAMPGPNETVIVFVPSGGAGFPGYGGAPPDVAAASSAGVSVLVSRSDHTHGHGNQAGGTLHALVVSGGAAGFISGTDKAALDALVAGAPYQPAGSYVLTTRTLTAGAGLTGGGDLSADRTFTVGQNADNSVVVNADDVQVNPTLQAGAALGATSVQPARTITAGAGMTGGGDLSANRTLDVGQNADNSILVNADDIQLNPTFNLSSFSSGQIGQAPAIAGLQGRSLHYALPTSNTGVTTLHNFGMNCTLRGTATTSTPTSADLRQSEQRSQMTSAVANTLIGCTQDAPFCFRGNLPGVGGWFWSWRTSFPQMQTDTIIFIGLTGAAKAGGEEASGRNNSICFGADSGDTDLTIITRDNAGSITKSAAIMTKAALATGDPNTGFARILEFQMWCAPNASSIQVRIYDWSNAAWIIGPTPTDVTLTLPSATVALLMWGAGSTKTALTHTQGWVHTYGYY